jgi:hypothetical protein
MMAVHIKGESVMEDSYLGLKYFQGRESKEKDESHETPWI